jgi:polar amino acid transport system substrate-binding protein
MRRTAMSLLICMLLMAGSLACAEQPLITFAISDANTLPLVEIHDYQVQSGILKDLGEAIAMQLQRKAQFIPIPRKRLDQALHEGKVDGICYSTPEWLSEPLNWSQPLIPNENLLVAGAGGSIPPDAWSKPPSEKLSFVAGARIGTVLGYYYPELDAVLKKDDLREDAPNMSANIAKLLKGRMPYAVVDRLSWSYHAKSNPELNYNFDTLSISKINARCGFSGRSTIPFGEIDQAIHTLVKEGAVERILARYR